MKWKLFSVALVVASFNLQASPEFMSLDKARKELVIPSYSAEQRQTLLDQSELVLNELFVHRDIKMLHFGKEANSRAQMESIKQNLLTLTDDQLHESFSKAFAGLHDLHTNFFSPSPFGCGAVFVPLQFESVKSGNKTIVVVSKIIKLKGELAEGIEVKDRVLEYNGLPIEKALNLLKPFSGGANQDAMRSRALELLSFKSLMSENGLPKEDTLKLKLQNEKGVYEKEIPWQSILETECIEPQNAKHTYDAKAGKTKFFDGLKQGSNDYQERYNTLFGTPKLVPNVKLVAGGNEFEEIFDVGFLNSAKGKVGYIRLKTFHWKNRNLDTPTVIDGIRRVIEVAFADTAGLVVDVRSNPGGNIVFAEKLLQLFSAQQIEPSTFRMLANPLNEEIFLKANEGENRWSKEIRRSINAKEHYTTPMTITAPSEANRIGQVWFKPTVVLTDSNCFSACDMFTAGMQDAKAATIIGMNRTTGGGGANVMEYTTFQSVMGDNLDNPFKELSFNQNMRVAWRQVVRSGAHQGDLIEDTGVLSDIVVPLKLEDIGTGSKELLTQVNKAVFDLVPNYTSAVATEREGVVVLRNGSLPMWKEKVTGVDTIEVSQNGKIVSVIDVKLASKMKQINLDAGELQADWQDMPVVLTGFRDDEQVFRVIRELKWRGDYVEIPEAGLKINFDDCETGPLKTMVLSGAANTGWKVVDAKLRIGDGPEYGPQVSARAVLPLALNGKGGKFKMDVAVTAEDDNDSFRVYVLNPDTGERRNV